jgi:DHA2 family multidrug resistance protein
MLGFVLYAAVYLIPVYLAVAHGYSARQAGAVMLWIGLPQLFIIPFMPLLMKRFEPRRLLAFGFFLFAVSSFMNMNLGPDDSGPQLLIPNLIRAVGQAFVFPPISAIATAGIDFKDAASASSMFNMMRNLGGAIGIAVVQTFTTNREKFHSAIITPDASMMNQATRSRIGELQAYLMSRGLSDAAAAQHEAVIIVGRTIEGQSTYLAYGDSFALLGVGMVAAMVLALLLKPAPGPAAPGGH